MFGRCGDCKQLFEPNERAEKQAGTVKPTQAVDKVPNCLSALDRAPDLDPVSPLGRKIKIRIKIRIMSRSKKRRMTRI